MNDSYRCISHKLYEELRNNIDNLISNKWVSKWNSIYTSPVLCIQKKDGFLCLFIRLQDYIQHAQKFNVFSTHFSLCELFQILRSFTDTPPSFQCYINQDTQSVYHTKVTFWLLGELLINSRKMSSCFNKKNAVKLRI